MQGANVFIDAGDNTRGALQIVTPVMRCQRFPLVPFREMEIIEQERTYQ